MDIVTFWFNHENTFGVLLKLNCHSKHISGQTSMPFNVLLAELRSGEPLVTTVPPSVITNCIQCIRQEVHCCCCVYVIAQEVTRKIQSNFNGSNTFGTMKICSRQG